MAATTTGPRITRHSLKSRVALINRKLDDRRAALARYDGQGRRLSLSERRDRLQTAVAYLNAAAAADPEAADLADWAGVRRERPTIAN